MQSENPSIISHLSVGTNDFAKAVEFYDQVMSALGYAQIMKVANAVAYGKAFPEFWVQTPYDGKPATVGNGFHVGFIAHSKAAVHAFYEAALRAGGTAEGEPGPRPDYGDAYYGCYVRDLDGNKIEATYWNEQQS